MKAFANLSDNAAGTGPVEMTDALGRKFWRFSAGALAYLRAAANFSLASRGMSMFMVGRWHAGAGVIAGLNVTMTAPSFRTFASTEGVPYLAGSNRIATSDAVNAKYAIPGSQMQVIGLVSNASNQYLYINNTRATVAIPTSSTTGTSFDLGRDAFTAAAYGNFDCYYFNVYQAVLTQGQGDAIAAALVTNWSIADLTNQAITEGDSITAATVLVGQILPSQSRAMALTEPASASALPASWRVINLGVSGNRVANLVTRRDAANTIFGATLSGRNVVVVEIGYNDTADTSAADIYTALVAYYNTVTTGVLERGWEARPIINIGTGNAARQAVLVSLRTLLRDPQFLTDTLSNTGQTYDGKLGRIELPLVTLGGNTLFDTSANAGVSTYYQTDSVHPQPVAHVLAVTGADTPTLGISARIQAAV